MVTTVRPPTTTLITSAEFEEMYGEDDRVELWRGVVVEMSPVKSTHWKITFRLGMMLGNHVQRSEIGEIAWGEAGFTIEEGPDTVVAPDLTLVVAAASSAMSDDIPGFPRYVPPLVVEVKSPGDTERQIAEKLALYLAAGVAEIWWVRPRQRTLTRSWADRDPVVLNAGDTLAEIDVLPGFSMVVGDIFPPAGPTEGAA